MIYVFAVFLLFAGANHFIRPGFYEPFMPDWMPKDLANQASGLVEIIIGILLLLPAQRFLGLWGALLLMILFLPIHVLDLLKDTPAIGSKQLALIRLLLQFLLIAWLVWELRKYYDDL
ncbi:MAG: hypothetical protein AAF433_22680 [Bacteroidota bacterium]